MEAYLVNCMDCKKLTQKIKMCWFGNEDRLVCYECSFERLRETYKEPRRAMK
jgi:hypothetical protein